MIDLRPRKLFSPFAVEQALNISIPAALRAIADAIDTGDLAALDYAFGASPCRLQIGHRDDERFLFRVAIDLAAGCVYVHDPTTQLEGLEECRTSAPAWDATTPHPTATASAPKPAANEPVSASSRRSGDASSPERYVAPFVVSRQQENGRS